MQLILASSSPRRKQLLASAGYKIDLTVPPNIDETPLAKELPHKLTVRLACTKAKAVGIHHPEAMIIAADTVVYINQKYLHQPQNIEEARTHLKRLSGRRHRVYTGVCVLYQGVERKKYAEAIVKFKRLTESEIEKYLKTDEWKGRAGGYSIEDKAGVFIEWMSGVESTLLGLPLNITYNLINSFKIVENDL